MKHVKHVVLKLFLVHPKFSNKLKSKMLAKASLKSI